MTADRWEIYVNAYLVNRAYGGGEGGGWWYDYGEPLAAVPVALTSPYKLEVGEPEDDNYTEPREPDMNGISDDDCDRIKDVIDDLNKTLAHHNDNRGIGSVLCTGVVQVFVEMRYAKAWPENKPHYE